jgi:deoxyribodipyrimidine photo-lyase
MKKKVIFWHRRDLRLEDNAGLFYALNSGFDVQPLFIFDVHILEKLPNKDARVCFIHNEIVRLKQEYKNAGTDLIVLYGKPEVVLMQLLQSDVQFAGVYANTDYEPYAKKRDSKINESLQTLGLFFKSFKDHVFFDYTEVLKDDGTPYTVFTPYSKKWKARFIDYPQKSYPSQSFLHACVSTKTETQVPSLQEMGFESFIPEIPSKIVAENVIAQYHLNRDFPSVKGTSKLGIHFRFGTVSIRKMVENYIQISPKYVDELIWRDFYSQILAHFPHVVQGAFKPQYDNIVWRNNEQEFEKWKEGRTGVAIVDAGMRELSETGFMHNRVRMIVASYLCKNLLIDWRWGEAWFAEKLLDFDLASNNGGWQWAAGSGVDAAPYFRIFNPELQTKKFDPNLSYIQKWVPEHKSLSYMQSQIVPHDFARKRCLDTYKAALKS